MPIIAIAFSLFVITNPIGNSPAILALVRHNDIHRQRRILLREGVLAFLIAVLFLFLGDPLLRYLHVEGYSLSLSGGIILLLVALEMIFPHHIGDTAESLRRDPMLVPIATPLLAGGGLLTTIMIYGRREGDNLKMLAAIALSFSVVITVLLLVPLLQRLLGQRGMSALEQLMGLVLAMLSIELILQGTTLFISTVG